MQWLAPFDPTRIHERSIDSFLEGTGEWLLDGAFAQWLDGKGPPLLWLLAKRKRPRALNAAIIACTDCIRDQLALVKQPFCKLDIVVRDTIAA